MNDTFSPDSVITVIDTITNCNNSVINTTNTIINNTNSDPQILNSLSDSLIPQLSFQLLAIAMALAAFLPVLIYTYAKDLLRDIVTIAELIRENDSKLEDIKDTEEKNRLLKKHKELDDRKKRITSFLYSIDLIVTQSIFLVLLVAFEGLVIYIQSITQLSVHITSILLIILYIIYFYKPFRYSFNYIFTLSDIIKKNWTDYQKYQKTWLGLIIFYIGTSVTLIILHLFNVWLYSLFMILAFSTVYLLISACIWIFPLIQYSPLQASIEDKLDLIKSGN